MASKSGWLFLLIGMAACSPTQDPALIEAAGIHREAIEVEKELMPRLDSLRQLRNSINVQGRALRPEELAFVAEVDQLELRLENWEKNQVEVPGMEEHDHNHGEEGHDHHHHHGSELNLSSADLLIVQKELRDSIQALYRQADRLLRKGLVNADLK